MTHHGLKNVHKSRLKYFGRCQVGISASTSEEKKTRLQNSGKFWENLRKNLGKSGKIWENLEKSGKSEKIWENLGKSGKICEKSENFRNKSGCSSASAPVFALSAPVFAVCACVLNVYVSVFICCNSDLYVVDTCKPKLDDDKLVSDNLTSIPFANETKL